MPKARLLLVEPVINPPGGAQCLAAWALEALRETYTVDVMTWTPIDFDEINRFYGTTLAAKEFKRDSAPRWLDRLVSLDPDSYSFQRAACLMRLAMIRRSRYNLLVSFMDEVDFHCRAIQYIHFPYLKPHYDTERRLKAIPGLRGRWQTELFKHRPWRVISGFTFKGMQQNITLANSNWTGAIVKDAYGIEPTTLYPPVPGDFPSVPWEQRENGFVCIGRLSGEKRYDSIIAILAGVRARGHAIHLHLIGAVDEQPGSQVYRRQMMEWVDANADWITLHENIARAELIELVAHHRYGIHGNTEEHFGIAVAEMVRGGAVVFVPNGGGQVEIVGEDARLRYDSTEKAVEKISRVLEDADAQLDLQAKLAERATLFTPERFMDTLSAFVANHLDHAAR